ncbi:hypothetical protein L1887_07296 [Cichorium endivia]|nr:hypothetical protein L1887_07296 [Cichorium endivia]
MDVPHVLFLLLKLSVAILLLSLCFATVGEATYQCQGKCEDMPDCDALCKRFGFLSGDCMPPLYQASMNSSKVVKIFKSVANGSSRASIVKSHRAFVTASKPLQKDRSEEKVEKTCDQVTQAADAVKKGATQITNMTKDVRGKVSEATDTITQKAKDDVVDVAGKKLKQTVVDENK